MRHTPISVFSLVTALLLGLSSLLTTGTAQAALQVEITEGVSGRIPIAIVPFGGSKRLPPNHSSQ